MAGRGKPIREGKLTPVYLASAWHEDEETGALVNIGHILNVTHKGEIWYLEMFSGTVADSGSIILAGVMPADRVMHFTFAGACGGQARIELIEGCAFSSSGTAHLPFNMNRNIGDAGAMECYGNPTLVGGTVLQNRLLPGGEGKKAGGGDVGTREGTEWITKVSESYAVRLTNISGEAQDTWLAVNFHPEEV